MSENLLFWQVFCQICVAKSDPNTPALTIFSSCFLWTTKISKVENNTPSDAALERFRSGSFQSRLVRCVVHPYSLVLERIGSELRVISVPDIRYDIFMYIHLYIYLVYILVRL